MKRGGIWIDHANACVVAFAADGEAIVTRLESRAPGRSKSQGGMVGTRGQVGGASHTKADRRRLGQLQLFYEEVVEAIRGLDDVAILGPGLAKRELEKVLRERAGRARIVAVLTTDQMTEPQIIAKLRELLHVRKPD